MADPAAECDVSAERPGEQEPLEIRSELVAFFGQQGLAPRCLFSAEFDDLRQPGSTVDHDYAKHVLRLAKADPAHTEAQAARVQELVRLVRRDARPAELHGMCAQVTEVVLAMLIELGIWCFGVMGSTAVQSGIRSKSFFFDPDPERGQACGHHWIVAPPFVLVDLTIAHQSNIAGWERLLPDLVLSRESEAPPSDKIVLQDENRGVAYNIDDLQHLWRWLPRRMIDSGSLQILYQPHDIQLPGSSLDGEAGKIEIGGRPAREWFREAFPEAKVGLK